MKPRWPRISLTCGSGTSTGGNVTATIAGVSWRTAGQGYFIPGSDGSTGFTLQGGTPLPNSLLLDSSKPQRLIVFPQLPPVGTYAIDGVIVNVEYQVDTNTL